MSDRELIQRVLAGDIAAERALYDAHVDRVYRLAFRMAGDENLAQEFTQEAFVRAFSRLDTFRGAAALSTWLHSITVSVVLNGLRKEKRNQSRETDLDEAMVLSTAAREVEPDLKTRLHAAINALAEHYRTVFVMHDVEGYTHDEIGAVLEIPTGTSKARLSRARSRLREALSDFSKEWAV